MADFDEYKPIVGLSDYPTLYNNFITRVQGYATEEENAREYHVTNNPVVSILENLQANYIKYTLAAPVSGASTHKCTNMAAGVLASDYITIQQANQLTGVQPGSIEEIDVGSLQPNDILVVDSFGNHITGRSTKYITVPATSAENGNYDMALGTGNKFTTLPVGQEGMVISYADLGGNAGVSGNLTITPYSGASIMGLAANETLVIDDYPYCSFDLVFTSATPTDAFGWTIARFQR